MKILLTGANGYIGSRLLPVLLEQGHDVWCTVREPARFNNRFNIPEQRILKIDYLQPGNGDQVPKEIDAAYYLVHSMSGGGGFEEKEKQVAEGFIGLIEGTNCKQIIYLTGIVNAEILSAHLSSRLAVERILSSGPVPLTALRAGIIVGSGSASFEIIRDLTEKLPIMIAPKWVNTKTQPIAIRNVIEFLTGVLGNESFYNQNYDVAGPDILTYREMILGFARVRGLKRFIYTVPVMTPRLSSYWLYFITSTSYSLAVNLVDSMKIDVVARPNNLADKLGIELIDYESSVELAFLKIGQNLVVSSWKDAFSVSNTGIDLAEYAELPEFGSFRDTKTRIFSPGLKQVVLNRIWSLGGETGWYFGTLLWKFRGYLDKLFGGIGLRRGRRHPIDLHPGDALDFWRVIIADREKMRLLLFAEMKLPGEAWLEFRIEEQENKTYKLVQTAVFRPLGVWGRLYWFSVLPFHYFIFNGMIEKLVQGDLSD
ncbi:MAG: SDR family oxidoreductase [Saprospirales bacterium]|nr:MAG: SDR family oxidoreductase [Saprospirales bacterium]